ncbi:MAG: hypothetical protein M3Z06_04800 [Actinomycetota bacterium]|nr:hypothetical protein [Actinomycetota bacterium]
MIAVVAIPASASAKSEFHFFGQGVSFTVTDRGFSVVDVLYVGNHSSHAEHAIGLARLSCVFTSQDRSLCNGKIELPDGTLLANHVFVSNGEITTVEINGGTGAYAGASGFARTVSVTDSTSDFTVVLR